MSDLPRGISHKQKTTKRDRSAKGSQICEVGMKDRVQMTDDEGGRGPRETDSNRESDGGGLRDQENDNL